MNVKWFTFATILALITGLVLYYFYRSIEVSLISSALIIILMVVYNPQRRFIKVFYSIILVFLSLNGFYFYAILNYEGTSLAVGRNSISPIVSVALLVVAILSLILDFLERKSKLKSILKYLKKVTFLRVKGVFKSNKVGDVNGNNNTINQSNK